MLLIGAERSVVDGGRVIVGGGEKTLGVAHLGREDAEREPHIIHTRVVGNEPAIKLLPLASRRPRHLAQSTDTWVGLVVEEVVGLVAVGEICLAEECRLDTLNPACRLL